MDPDPVSSGSDDRLRPLRGLLRSGPPKGGRSDGRGVYDPSSPGPP